MARLDADAAGVRVKRVRVVFDAAPDAVIPHVREHVPDARITKGKAITIVESEALASLSLPDLWSIARLRSLPVRSIAVVE